jgi:hypothetical protein
MRMNLMMGIFWLCVGIMVAVANLIGTDLRAVYSDGGRLVGGIAIVLAIYNFARWWAARTKQKAREAEAAVPPRKRQIEKPPTEYNPEFDFNQSEPPE